MDASTLYRMLIFASVVENGSLTAAADTLNISRSMVSQHLKKLELACNTKLLERTTRSMVLTEAGEKYYPICAELLQIAQSVAKIEITDDQELVGKITIHSPASYGQSTLLPLIAKFTQIHPRVNVQLILGDHLQNLSNSQFDIKITTQSSNYTGERSRSLHTFDDIIVASPKYMTNHNQVIHPDMLTTQDWINATANQTPSHCFLYNSSGEKFTIMLTPKISCNSNQACLELVKLGIGVAYLPSYLVSTAIKSGELIHLLPEYRVNSGEVYVTYSNLTSLPARVDAFIAFLTEQLQT